MNRRIGIALAASGTLFAVAAGVAATADLMWTGVGLCAAAELILAAAAVTLLYGAADGPPDPPHAPSLDDLLVRDHTRRVR